VDTTKSCRDSRPVCQSEKNLCTVEEVVDRRTYRIAKRSEMSKIWKGSVRNSGGSEASKTYNSSSKEDMLEQVCLRSFRGRYLEGSPVHETKDSQHDKVPMR
jgi:hypothetical protein